MWQADPEDVKILDVRTPEEWVFTAHAPMATNIPFAFLAYAWDDEKKGLPLGAQPRLRRPRQGVVRARRHAARVLPLRRRGRDGRSTCWRPRDFTNAYNILDGMEGSPVDDPDSVFHGMRLKNGWTASGLPWTYDLNVGRMALRGRETGTLHAGNPGD